MSRKSQWENGKQNKETENHRDKTVLKEQRKGRLRDNEVKKLRFSTEERGGT